MLTDRDMADSDKEAILRRAGLDISKAVLVLTIILVTTLIFSFSPVLSVIAVSGIHPNELKPLLVDTTFMLSVSVGSLVVFLFVKKNAECFN